MKRLNMNEREFCIEKKNEKRFELKV